MVYEAEAVMDGYKDLYFHLFNAITDALNALEAQNFGQAADLLRRAQQQTEELYLDAEDAPEPDDM